MQMQNAMQKMCDAMQWALKKKADANAMQKNFCTTVPV